MFADLEVEARGGKKPTFCSGLNRHEQPLEEVAPIGTAHRTPTGPGADRKSPCTARIFFLWLKTRILVVPQPKATRAWTFHSVI